MSIKEFYATYSTEKDCEDFFISLRWGSKENIVCPHCNCEKVYVMKSKVPFKCSKCRKLFSIKTGTVLAESNVKLQTWLLAIYFLTSSKKGMSSVELSEKLGCTQKTAWFLAHRIRKMYETSTVIGGNIEMDETFIGGKEGNKHSSKKQGYHGTEGKTAVMGAISREDKQVVAYPVKEVSYNTVETFREHNIKKDSMLYSDECKAYEGQSHFKVNHSMKEFVRDGHIHTNTIESFWAIIKRGYIGIYHWWSGKHLKRYINEFVYRYNKRIEDDIISQTVHNGIGKKLSYKMLIQ